MNDERLIWEAYVHNEGLVSNVGHIALDIAGLIPGLGEFADVTNAVWYAKNGDWLNSAFSLISMIPALGDVVGKGGRVAVWLAKAAKTTKNMGGAGRNVAKGIAVGRRAVVQTGGQIRRVQNLIKSNKPLIDKVFQQAQKNEKIRPYIAEIQKALNSFTGEAEPTTQEQSPAI